MRHWAIYQHLGYRHVQPTGDDLACEWPSDKVCLVLSIYSTGQYHEAGLPVMS